MSGPLVYYIRHGETAWSLSGQHTGRTDLALTSHGEDQARRLALRLKNIGFSVVLASPRQRARQTCDLAGQGASVLIEPDLAEWDYGDYEGLPSADIRRERPDWNIMRDGCPNGETPAQVVARADGLIARIRSLQGNIALFSHGQFGQVFVARWIGWPATAGQHFTIDPASLGILGRKPGAPDIPAILLWNSN